jgi:hypothetical protein
MVALIVGIITLFAFGVGFIIAMLSWNRDSRLETYYSKTATEIKEKFIYSSNIAKKIPKQIIVDSGTRVSPIRTCLRKTIAHLTNKTTSPVILVFGATTEDEQKAFLIQKAFVPACNNKLLDLSFIESLIYYFAYKYGHEAGDVDEGVKNILRKYFEGAIYRKSVIKLESLEFDNRIVLNPPPEARALLTNLVLPMAEYLEEKLISENASLSKMEEYKSFFMEIIRKICDTDCALIFIGIKGVHEYINLINKNLGNFSLFILAARGSHIGACSTIEKRTFAANWKNDSYKIFNIDGNWISPSDKQQIKCLWKIIFKIKGFGGYIPN